MTWLVARDEAGRPAEGGEAAPERSSSQGGRPAGGQGCPPRHGRLQLRLRRRLPAAAARRTGSQNWPDVVRHPPPPPGPPPLPRAHARPHKSFIDFQSRNVFWLGYRLRLSAEEASHRCLAARHQSPFTVGGQPGAGALVWHGPRRPAAPAGDPQGRRHLGASAPRRLGQPRRSRRVQSARALAAPRLAG